MSQYNDNNYDREPARRPARYQRDDEPRTGPNDYDSTSYDDYDRDPRNGYDREPQRNSRTQSSRPAPRNSSRSSARPSQHRTSRSGGGRSGGGIVLPRGIGLAAGAMAILLCLAIVFQQLA